MATRARSTAAPSPRTPALRVRYSPTNFLETFFNLRYLGGGARGPGSKTLSPEFGDGYNR